MDVQIVPLTNFIHGPYRMRAGQAMPLSESIARDLERAGLVRIRPAPVKASVQAGKETDDGQGQPSSASPAAPASRETTSRASRRGERQARTDESQ